MAQHSALDDLFDWNLEKLTKCPTFTDAFTAPALAFSCFVRPVANFICDKIEKESHSGDIMGKEDESLHPSPQTSPLVSNSSINGKLRNIRTDKTKKTDYSRHNERKSPREHQKSPPSSFNTLYLLLSPATYEKRSVITKTGRVRREKRVKPELHVFQTVKKNYSQVLDYQTYRLANKSSKYGETV